jgi:hypothetical protein
MLQSFLINRAGFDIQIQIILLYYLHKNTSCGEQGISNPRRSGPLSSVSDSSHSSARAQSARYCYSYLFSLKGAQV